VATLLRYAHPERGPGWNPRSPRDPALNVPRTRALLDLAGAPDRGMACALVGGTKGKGSTAAFLAAIASAAGVRAGLYTSPHLQSWRERIRVDGEAIASRAFAGLIEEAVGLVPRLRRAQPRLGEPSAFELLTVAALIHFARRHCRVAVLEVGLGGRFDATNAVDPAVALIAPIGLDHRAILGRSLAAIAREKAGILRAGRPAALARQRPAAARELVRACRASGAVCEVVGALGGEVRLGLAGEHQRQNAALARAAATHLGLPARAFRAGLRKAWLPGRYEKVRRGADVVLDGAHTPESGAALADTLRGERRPRRLHLVFGCTAERDPLAIARPLLALRPTVYATAAGPRALAPGRVAAALGAGGARSHASVAAALAAAHASAGAGGLVCVTGSLALVGEARTALGLPVAERLWSEAARV